MKTRTRSTDTELSRYLDSAEERALNDDRKRSVYPSNYAPSVWELNLPHWPENFDYAYLGHRDADLLAESNAMVTRQALSAANELAGRWDTTDPDDPEREPLKTVTFSRSSCSMFGWFDKGVIVVLLPCDEEHPHRASEAAVKACGLDPERPFRYSAAFLELMGLRDALESYPVLDEDDFSRRETDAKDEQIADAFRRARVKGDNHKFWLTVTDWMYEHAEREMEPDGYVERTTIERAAIAAGMQPDEDLAAELLSDWDIDTVRRGRYYVCRVDSHEVTRRRGNSAARWLSEQTRRVARLYSNGTMGPYAGG